MQHKRDVHQAMSARRVVIPQSMSPLFKLPAELRIAIYEYLRFPPVDNQQCYGLVMSCRRAKMECEQVAIEAFKTWLATYKQRILPKCTLDARILLPPLPPIRSSFKFNSIKELTVVLPASSILEPSWPSPTFFKNLRYLNPIFGLCLDKLTLHFRGSPEDKPQRPWGNDKWWVKKSFGRLQFILEGGLTYAHDPVGQAREKELRKYSDMWNYWKPVPSFIKRLVISWDLTEHGLSSDEFVNLGGVCEQHPTTACFGRRAYKVVDDVNDLVGEYMLESSCRFRPLENEEHMLNPPPEHKAVCLKCTSVRDYRRHTRGLPSANDERWV